MTRLALRIGGWIERVGEGRIAACLLVLAFLLRMAGAAHYGHFQLQPVENRAIAEALANNRGYADAFRPGSGPTAHTGPLAPLIMAAVFTIFGTGTLISAIVLTMLGAAAVTLSFYLVYRCFAVIGVPITVRLLALAFVTLVPFQLSLETTDLVVWEVAYATAFLAAMLLVILKLDSAPSVSFPALLGLAAATAFLELFSPASGLAAAGAVGLLLLRRTPWPMWLLVGGLTLAFFLAMTTPWKLRNEKLLGAPIRTRSSFGLSFAIGFHDGQLTAPSQREANMGRLKLIHPHHAGGPGYRLMREAGGEVAYNRKLVAETKVWIARHPIGAARIALRNLWNYYCPPTWFWDRWFSSATPPRAVSIMRSIMVSMLSLLGLGSLAWLVWQRRWRFIYFIPPVALPALPYVITFPLLRYRYPTSSILIFLAFTGVGILAAKWRGWPELRPQRLSEQRA